VAGTFRAQFAENAGELDRMRADLDAALARFRQAGDRWGQATTLPLRAQLRQYDDDLDGALADLRAARSLAAEFGELSLSDEVFLDLRWFDLHRRRGDTDRARAMIGSARSRVLRAATPGLLIVIDSQEAGFRVQLGELDRARELLEEAERCQPGLTAFPADHVQTLISSARSALCLATGDLEGAQMALAKAYTAALAARDRPILAVVAVNAAALADARGRHHESAVLLGVAARLRGAHDRSDGQVRELTGRGHRTLGEDEFAAAYAKGWQLDGEAAVTEADPARLGHRPGTAPTLAGG